MSITLNGQPVTLLKKVREVGSEAPSARVKMVNNETKVIGMMADKVQVIITLPSAVHCNSELIKLISRHSDKSLLYIFSPEIIKTVEPANSSTDFIKIAQKFGVFIDKTLCAPAVFVINKDGEIVYKEIAATVEELFDIAKLETALEEAIAFKKRGHTHENWMSV